VAAAAVVPAIMAIIVSAPVHPHVLIIVETHEDRSEHILATLQMT
jgi:hypothetical protein